MAAERERDSSLSRAKCPDRLSSPSGQSTQELCRAAQGSVCKWSKEGGSHYLCSLRVVRVVRSFPGHSLPPLYSAMAPSGHMTSYDSTLNGSLQCPKDIFLAYEVLCCFSFVVLSVLGTKPGMLCTTRRALTWTQSSFFQDFKDRFLLTADIHCFWTWVSCRLYGAASLCHGPCPLGTLKIYFLRLIAKVFTWCLPCLVEFTKPCLFGYSFC